MVHRLDNPIAQQILRAAVHLFAHKGFAATSTREIAEASGVTKPMLYYYFESKEGLCRAALDHSLETFHARFRQVLDTPREPFAQLVETVWMHFEFIRENKDLARLFFALFFGPENQVPGLDLHRYTAESDQLLGQLVEKVSRSGLFRPGCRVALTTALRGMLTVRVIDALKVDKVDLSPALARQIVEDLLQGFARK
jgi:AcrR family transcriptional regulator